MDKEMSERERLAWSVGEAASLVGVSRRTMYELIRSRKIQSVKIGGRRLIRRADLERFVNELEVRA